MITKKSVGILPYLSAIRIRLLSAQNVCPAMKPNANAINGPGMKLDTFRNILQKIKVIARTAVNIRLGAVSPVAGIAKFGFKLLLAAFLAVYLEKVPMACIGGILLYVASGMVKMKEIKEVLGTSKYHIALMCYTAAMVPLTGFMMAVVSAIIIYIVTYRFFDKRKEVLMVEEGEMVA